MERTHRLLALLLALALLLGCFGGALAEDAAGADNGNPAPVQDKYSVDGVTYYNVNSPFFDNPVYFLTDMMGIRSDADDKLSIAYEWLKLGLGCYGGQYGFFDDKDKEARMVQAAIAAFEHPDIKQEAEGSGLYSIATGTVYARSIKDAYDKLAEVTDCPSATMPGSQAYAHIEDYGKTQDVVAVYVAAWDSDQSKSSIGAVAFFTDFEAVALLPDDSEPTDPTAPRNYVTTTIRESSPEGRTYASNVKNLTLSPITASQSVTNGWSTTVTSTTSGSSTYTFSESIQLGWGYKFVAAKLSATLGFTASQAFQSGWSESTAKTDSGSVTESVSVALPPYTNVLLEQGSAETEYETKFNCPIALKYKVRLVGFKDNNTVGWTFGPDARANLYKRAIKEGQLDLERGGDPDKCQTDINWVKALAYADTQAVAKAISGHAPMSPQGATFHETLNTNYTTVKDIVPVQDLALTKLVAPSNVSFISGEEFSYGKLNFLHADMKVGDSSNTGVLTVKGLNAADADYYGFNQRLGSWKVVDKDGNALTGDDAPVVLDSATAATTKYTAQKPGTCYLKYYINEQCYPHVNANNGGYVTNDELEGMAALEITVTEKEVEPTPAPEYAIAVSGSYTGEVGVAPEKLDRDGGLDVSITDGDGVEIERAYTWQKRELDSRGISLAEDGTVSFTKPGTFHVRAVCAELGVTSDWVEISAFERTPAVVVKAPEANRLTYSGAAQALVTPGEAEGGSMVYALEDGDYTPEIPEARETGTYRVWYRAVGDSTHTDSEAGYTVVTILKAPVEPVTPSPDALVYNGQPQALVVPGTVEGGTIQYFLGDQVPEDEESWTAEVPTGTNAGNYTVWYRVKGDANHNDVPPASLAVTIDKRPLLVTAQDAAKTYGDADPALEYAAEGLVDADALTGALARAEGENVGDYAITQGTLAATDNYELYFNEGLLTIAPRPLTVKAQDATSVYGEADPELEYTVEGLLEGDQLTGRLAREEGADVGEYPITQGTLAAPGNYALSFEGAVFTITKRPVTVTAMAASKQYGDADPELEYTAEGLVGLDQPTGKLEREAGEDVGVYAIGQGSLDVGDNYTLSFVGAEFTIVPRTVTVTADAKSKVRGTADPALTYTASGLLDGDKLNGKLARDPGEAPGKYAITQGTLSAPENYTLAFKGAKLTIKEKAKLPAAPDYTLLAKMTSPTDTSVRIAWTKVAGAQGYDMFFRRCDGNADYPRVRSVSGTGCTVKGLKKRASYKAYVRAWKKKNGRKTYIGNASPVVHCITGGYSATLTNAKSVRLNKGSLTLVKGKTATLKASAKGIRSDRALLTHVSAIRYYSSNVNVAKVSRSGKVTAVDGGSCTIYAMANNGVRASAKVTVIADPKKVSFAKKRYTVAVGGTLKLAGQVTLTPVGVTSLLTWSSSDPTVATVSAKGVVKGVGKGTATITVSTDNGKVATTKVQVK